MASSKSKKNAQAKSPRRNQNHGAGDLPLGLLPDFAADKDTATLDLLQYIEDYDLTDIKKSIVDKFDEIASETGNKIQKPNSPCKPGEMRKYVDLLEKEFKKFLTLRLLFPDEALRFVPSRIVDRIWHKFIVDTRRYMAFCDHVYGEYLHHVPATSTPSAIAKNAGNLFATTKRFLTQAYGVLPSWAWGVTAGCDYQACMSGCFD